MACALSCLRAFFIILSIAYVLVGLAGGIASGVFIYIWQTTTEIKQLFELSNSQETFNHVVIAMGIVTAAFGAMLIAGFVGCCAMGRRHHNQCCQDVLAFFALLITLMFTAAVILLAVFRNKLHNGVETAFEVNMHAYGNVGGAVIGDVADSAVRAYVDTTQQSQKCCGSTGFESWKTLGTSWATANPMDLAPTSCCFRPEDALCNRNVAQMYTRGCSSVVGDISSEVFTVIYIVGAVIALVSLIEMLTACYMARTSNKGGGCCC
eukprot:scpid87450/ scgid7006/ Tetraspanin-3; OSP-associated protein 1; Tetraspanin TM4-A; Transmembrane 4 superfamily member 8